MSCINCFPSPNVCSDKVIHIKPFRNLKVGTDLSKILELLSEEQNSLLPYEKTKDVDLKLGYKADKTYVDSIRFNIIDGKLIGGIGEQYFSDGGLTSDLNLALNFLTGNTSEILDLYLTPEFQSELITSGIKLKHAVAIKKGEVLTVSFELENSTESGINLSSTNLFGLPTAFTNIFDLSVVSFIPEFNLALGTILNLRTNMITSQGMTILPGITSFSNQISVF